MSTPRNSKKTTRPYRLLKSGSSWCTNTYSSKAAALDAADRLIRAGETWRLHYREPGTRKDQLVAEIRK